MSEDLAGMAERLEKALASGKYTLLDPLPRRVRLRLWRDRQVDRLAFRLVERRHFRSAITLWRAFGGWS